MKNVNEPVHDKTYMYNMTCATSNDSDQPTQSDQSSLITYALYNLWAIQRGINENPSHTGWMYRLIWVFAGHTGLIVGFVEGWLKCQVEDNGFS